MTEPRDLPKHIEHLIERAQDEILAASRDLAEGITKETERFVPPISMDIERMVDVTFDFAERVIKGQRKMVNDVVKTINEQRSRAADAGRATTQKAVRRVATAKSASAKKKTVPEKSAAKSASAKKKTVPKKSAAKKVPANKTMTGR